MYLSGPETDQQPQQRRQTKQQQPHPPQEPRPAAEPPQEPSDGRQQGGQPQSEERTEYVQEPPEMDFSDVAGMGELKAELRDRVIEPLQNPEKYDQYGLSVETGFLLYGPPGTGKTYFSKALAGEMGINYMPVKGSDLNSQFVGAGTDNIASMFAEARDNQPVLLFLDEIDALVPERGGANQHEDQTQQVNTFLEEVSEIHDEDYDIVVVGATNRRDRMDDAMLRPGRLSEQIEVPPPDAEARAGILDHHLDAPRARLDYDAIKEATDGLTGADMERVAQEGARQAMRREGVVSTSDVLEAAEELKQRQA